MQTFLSAAPIGVNPVVSGEKQIVKAFNGDAIVLTTRVALPGGQPATPDNSILMFGLCDTRFHTTPIWTGTWHDGISVERGLVSIRIPDSVSASLRRGSFLFSLLVTDRLGHDRATAFEGTLLIEYAPTSPLQDIPYKDEA